jgi:uncharacterized phage protein (TIGR01671 family)
MNREIKFRAWDKVNKRMGYFHPGFSWNDEYYLWHLSEVGDGDITDVPCGDNIELMQFTGLRDKNGVEIYEGDIVRVTADIDCSKDFDSEVDFRSQTIICKVVFREETAAFDLSTIKADTHLNAWGFYGQSNPSEEMEVIGNIYEHSHLLTNEKERADSAV